ncbi:MAG: hypothetical protein ACLTE9_17660 [Thomasclavelia ramosa]
MKSKVRITKNILLILILVLIGTYFGLSMLNGIFINEFNEIYLKLWERGLNGIYFIIYLIIMFELVMNELYSNINSKFDKSIVVRVGYSKYYIHSVVKVFFTSIAYALMTIQMLKMLSLILMINCYKIVLLFQKV